MTTQTRNENPSSIESDLSATKIFSLLSNDRRRYALHYLSTQVGDVHLGELAEQIAIWEDEPTNDRYERIYVGLVHNHVPKLESAGVIESKPDKETVALSENVNALCPYLELAESDDIR